MHNLINKSQVNYDNWAFGNTSTAFIVQHTLTGVCMDSLRRHM